MTADSASLPFLVDKWEAKGTEDRVMEVAATERGWDQEARDRGPDLTYDSIAP